MSISERNPTESSTPLGFVLAPPKELTAYCSACASAYNPLAARLPARIARSLAHVNRSSSERNPTESTALLAQLMELGTCDVGPHRILTLFSPAHTASALLPFQL